MGQGVKLLFFRVGPLGQKVSLGAFVLGRGGRSQVSSWAGVCLYNCVHIQLYVQLSIRKYNPCFVCSSPPLPHRAPKLPSVPSG